MEAIGSAASVGRGRDCPQSPGMGAGSISFDNKDMDESRRPEDLGTLVLHLYSNIKQKRVPVTFPLVDVVGVRW